MFTPQTIELIEINLPLVHFFETSFGRTYERRIILVRVEDAEGDEGWGEVTCGEVPGYSDEWTDSAWITAENILAPMVVGKEVGSAAEVWDLMKTVRGHRMAKAGIETACWDLEAKKLGVPLWRHLGGVNQTIECGVSIGIQDSVEQLFEKIQVELDAGYQRIKIKIAPHWDYDVIKAVREEFGDIPLMGDANSAYTLADIDKLKSLDEFGLMMLEQPLPYDDIVDHAKLQRQIKTPICLDEPIKSPDDARKAIELGSGKIINLKNGRVGGHSQSKLIEKICRENNIAMWCGGMLESGIGRAHNIAISTLAGYTMPGDVSASKRYWHEDIISPEVEVSPEGTIPAPDGRELGLRSNEIESRRYRHGAYRWRRVKMLMTILAFTFGMLVAFSVGCGFISDNGRNITSTPAVVSSTPVPTKPRIPANSSSRDLCDRLSEIKILPNKDPKDTDPIYEALLAKGEQAYPCLIAKITDETLMPDPRQAPHVQEYTVGDTAVFVLVRIIRSVKKHGEQELLQVMLPQPYRDEWKTNGIYAYFNYVSEPKNRKELQRWWQNWLSKKNE